MSNITIKELALKLNLSAATVSRALSDSYQISTATKQRVWDLAKKLNYEPNPSASTLRSHKTKTLAVIVPEIANNFFSQAINGIEEVSRQHGYHVLIYQTHENSEIEAAFIKSLVSGRVDGVLISVSSETNNKDHFTELNKTIPVVFFDRALDNMEAVKITTNDYESAYNATEHLIECGCKKISFLFALNNLSTGKNRLNGYIDALTSNNIAYDETLIINCDKDENQNYSHIKDLLTKNKPDGLISSIEELVLPCYAICEELNINIPDDLKIVSFSNLKTAPFLNPSLTTITQPAFEIGITAATLILKLLNKKQVDTNEVVVLKSDLIERGSTAVKKN
ncbi:LacI family DNA-binding transcriptional regulator [Mucilaginibacter aquariorum]|uniref:LacI family transcriptional regulator n=1 Tax=Mucilaginibacter aquariorum TaxID=2967225 RepID=A0ABT1SX54_9SPHI|nr:LacI family DNA-binding transcriptional regulator [Mucilaginibacter aquariorum]MCQ6956935.1 LacI family transcriptional regulator [Mucilaginibacter aquariorum]